MLVWRLRSVKILDGQTEWSSPTAQHYAAVVDSSDDAIIAKTLDGIITSWNPAATRIFGYSEAEATGQSIELIVPADRLHDVQSVLARIGRGEKVLPFETVRRRKDGTLVHVAVSVWPIRSATGEVIGAAKVARDLSERRLADERFMLTVEAFPAALVAIRADGRISLINSETERLFGYARSELMDRSVELLLPDAARPGHPELRNAFFRQPTTRMMGTGRDLRGRRKDGTEFPIEIALNVIPSEQGIQVMAVVVDITERRRAQDVLLREAITGAKLAQSLAIAHRVQTSILPRLLEVPGLEIAAGMFPAGEVGGDYYDVLPAEEGAWIAIGDVCGHGLNAGLVMLMLQSTVRGLTHRQQGVAPHALLVQLNEILYDNIRARLQQDEHITLTLMRYTRDGKVVFAGAHEDILLYRARTHAIEAVRPPGTWLAAFPDISHAATDGHLQLEDGDLMVLFTDGITEAMNASREPFDLPRLLEALRSRHNSPVSSIRDGIFHDVRRWALKQEDDMSLVVIRHSAKR